MKMIECKDLVLGYSNKQIIENLTFCIENGDYLCILGENGSGKTTLMRTILGLNKPLSGEILFSKDLNPTEIGYLPQQTSVQKDFPASVYEVVISGCLNKCRFLPFYSAEQKKSAWDNMKLLGIDNISDKCYRELSGGQQQKVLLARALCASSKLLLLDEPVTGLDPRGIDDMYSLISGLNSKGITIIMITHDVDSAVKYASHILHIGHRPKFFGTANEYLQSDIYRKSVMKGGGLR